MKTQKRTPLKIKLLLLLVALLCVFLYIAQKIPMPPAVWHVGVGLFGIAGIAMGIDHIRTKSASESIGEDSISYRTYTGTAAVFSGIVMVLFGVLLLAVSWALLSDTGEQMWAFVKRYPSLGLIPLGLGMIAWGGYSVLGAHEESPGNSFWLFLASIPARLFGIVIILGGAVIGAIGIFDLFSPGAFQVFLQYLKSLLPKLPE